LTAKSILKRRDAREKPSNESADTENRKETSPNKRYRGKECRVCLIKEEDDNNGKPITIASSKVAYEVVKEELGLADRETLLSILLSTRLHLIGVELIATGGLNACFTAPRELFRGAILANADSVILAHNHPSGDVTPSPEDIEFTQRMIKAGNLLGIKIRDHIIVTPAGYLSLADSGLIGTTTKSSRHH